MSVLLVPSIFIIGCVFPLLDFAYSEDSNPPGSVEESVVFTILNSLLNSQTICAIILPTFGIISHVIITSSPKKPSPHLLGPFLSMA
ncbi:MAG TPA: hypothetical protein VNX01_10205 [Bacteroidia bacterium]|nr:hypothetical protein [Bacteroidia bacterium]